MSLDFRVWGVPDLNRTRWIDGIHQRRSGSRRQLQRLNNISILGGELAGAADGQGERKRSRSGGALEAEGSNGFQKE